jgi:YD repeat-containing protein
MLRTTKIALGALTIGLISLIATAAETVTYTYDARGRFIKVLHTGTVNNNNQVCYKLDKAGNRTNKKSTVNSLPTCP